MEETDIEGRLGRSFKKAQIGCPNDQVVKDRSSTNW